MQAYEAADPSLVYTDDAAVFEAVYGQVHLSRADSARGNIKLTTAEDLELADLRFSGAFRTGTGYDVHRLAEGRKLVLCGVEIPFEKGLLGHSDADVALHALMDALLGAAALGDIGRHFPDSDPQYKGISSLELLTRVRALTDRAGFRAQNVDVTIVCQRPKLAAFIPKMRENIASALDIGVERVSVKATTTEGLGFEGEGEGISAQAAALVRGK
ncbi:MAG: 2-C-methyl-D-erythritol 2,4-cyclodiphosphate synthase [Clostridia bacterium]|nr:2-C-methyl-D-erythritol 2,4-cyclodiphosphate synthase [Clostridia bacterium]